MNNLSRIKWACRRGMLELDILLSTFLEEKFSRLTSQQQRDFVLLLTHTDPELMSWLMGFENPPTEALAAIVSKVREHKKLHV